jgi:CxxC motif-containing protein (DUF1111 family)
MIRGRTGGLLLLLLGMGLQGCGQESSAPDISSDEALPGGKTTIPVLSRANAFSFAVDNISIEHERLFQTGNRIFNQSWVTAPSSTEGFDGIGPLFNARSCSACHFRDGRGAPPLESDQPFEGLLLRLSVDSALPADAPDSAAAAGAPVAEPTYGGQLQPFAIQGIAAEGTPRVAYSVRAGKYPDGERYELLVPEYTIDELAYGAMVPDVRVSPRVAPAMIGLGLLEAIPERRLLELADPEDEDDDGISGRPNTVWDVERGETVIGRFGWKAEQPSVRQQSAGALLGDMGIVSELFPAAECTAAQADCANAPSGGQPEIDAPDLDRLVLYSSLLGVPVRETWDTEAVLDGRRLFSEIGCASCHVPDHQTGKHAFDEVQNTLIWPYTDLLLHDMGEDLSDHRPSFAAAGNEWRTPPLWGNRFYEDVNGHNRLLHDGRARGVAEAILWHGGEAKASQKRFVALTRDERSRLVQFVESL